MTKLEEKLVELGYIDVRYSRWRKNYDRNKDILIITDEFHEKIKEYRVEFYSFIECQQDINELQQAFNVMQKDLKELKEFTNKNLEEIKELKSSLRSVKSND